MVHNGKQPCRRHGRRPLMRRVRLGIVLLPVMLSLGGCVVTVVTTAASIITNTVQSVQIDRLEKKIERGPKH